MKITAPNARAAFTIGANATWPTIQLATDAAGVQHTWNWKIVWLGYSRSGSTTTAGCTWNATSVVTDLGGEFTVRATAKPAGRTSTEQATVTMSIVGTNPDGVLVNAYIATKPNASGFDAILKQESKYRHFNSQKEPIKSFDNGYGMCQLTTPVPTYEQVWNWKRNIDGGLALFAGKYKAAIAYLSQSGRSYTADQLKREAVCRWNGGAYHVWDAKEGWRRPTNIVCDGATGNIGWDMNDTENAGKTEAQLRARDKDTYNRPPGANAHWKYFGICYADHILG